MNACVKSVINVNLGLNEICVNVIFGTKICYINLSDFLLNSSVFLLNSSVFLIKFVGFLLKFVGLADEFNRHVDLRFPTGYATWHLNSSASLYSSGPTNLGSKFVGADEFS